MSYDFSNKVVDAQPWSLGNNAPGSQPVNGVTLRCLTDTPEDALFAGTLTVEAFRGKMEFVVSKEKIPALIRLFTSTHRGQDPSFYSRTFVADYEGRRAGLIQLKYRDSTERSNDDHLCDLGCWRACRLICFGCVADESVGRNKCYVDHIAVDGEIRGKGIGRLLLDRAEYEAKQRGCTSIYLGVVADNRAKSLYERQGYAYTDTITCCMGCCIGPPGKVYIMEKPL